MVPCSYLINFYYDFFRNTNRRISERTQNSSQRRNNHIMKQAWCGNGRYTSHECPRTRLESNWCSMKCRLSLRWILASNRDRTCKNRQSKSLQCSGLCIRYIYQWIYPRRRAPKSGLYSRRSLCCYPKNAWKRKHATRNAPYSGSSRKRYPHNPAHPEEAASTEERVVAAQE